MFGIRLGLIVASGVVLSMLAITLSKNAGGRLRLIVAALAALSLGLACFHFAVGQEAGAYWLAAAVAYSALLMAAARQEPGP